MDSERIADVVEEALGELPARLRGSRARLSEQALRIVDAICDELNLVRREHFDELELRVAQLEHRLRLVERDSELPAP